MVFAGGNGQRRTNSDKRKAVMTLLEDEEWSQWSGAEIGRRCAVSHEFVNGIRRSLATVASEKPPRTYTNKHGQTATMNTQNIGRKSVGGKVKLPKAERIKQITELAERGFQPDDIGAELGISAKYIRGFAGAYRTPARPCAGLFRRVRNCICGRFGSRRRASCRPGRSFA